MESLGAGQRQSQRTQEDGPGKGLGSPMRQDQRLKQIWSANRRWDQRAEQVKVQAMQKEPLWSLSPILVGLLRRTALKLIRQERSGSRGAEGQSRRQPAGGLARCQ